MDKDSENEVSNATTVYEVEFLIDFVPVMMGLQWHYREKEPDIKILFAYIFSDLRKRAMDIGKLKSITAYAFGAQPEFIAFLKDLHSLYKNEDVNLDYCWEFPSWQQDLLNK